MTIVITALRLANRIWGVLAGRLAGALRTHVEAIRWRRRILRSLDQRRRG